MHADDGKLDEPPIIEVVCGVSFKSVRELDPVLLGAFWRERRADFPRREYKAPIALPAGAFGVTFGPDIGPIRTWLISKNDDLIIQVQHDRFYLNWRKRQDEYPRFTDRPGRPPGLLSRFLTELNHFTAFLAREASARLELSGLELAKLDRLTQGRHWSGVEDLLKLLPMLETPLKTAPAGEPTFHLRVGAPAAEHQRTEVVVDGTAVADQREIRVDFNTALARTLELAEVEASMQRLNDDLNALFRRVLPEQHRFKKGWQPA